MHSPFAPIFQAAAARALTDAGASFEELRIESEELPDKVPFPRRIVYRGLSNLPSDSPHPRDGSFELRDAGAGAWELPLVPPLRIQVGRTFNTDLPFEPEPEVIGTWETLDFVREPSQFDPEHRTWSGELFLREVTFSPDGVADIRYGFGERTRSHTESWTRGALLDRKEQRVSAYELRPTESGTTMFLEWISGDVIYLGMPPCYYVLRRR